MIRRIDAVTGQVEHEAPDRSEQGGEQEHAEERVLPTEAQVALELGPAGPEPELEEIPAASSFSASPSGEERERLLLVLEALLFASTEALSVGVAIDNLLDKDYYEAVGFPAAGIRGRIGAKYSF